MRPTLTYTYTPIGDIALDPEDGVSDHIVDYITVKKNCCTSFRDNVDLAKLLTTALDELRARSSHEVAASASAGNAMDCLELGLR
jgi:hypothetical protein